jgi:hypothetical protein
MKPISQVGSAERSLVGHPLGSRIFPQALIRAAGLHKRPADEKAEAPKASGNSRMVAVAAIALSGLLLILGMAGLAVAWLLTR